MQKIHNLFQVKIQHLIFCCYIIRPALILFTNATKKEMITLDEIYCKNCKHYRQHYTFDRERLFRVPCGHCVFQKVKRKAPDAKACEHYIFSPPDESAFASREYLSKELLKYVLNLPLLPAIEDGESDS